MADITSVDLARRVPAHAPRQGHATDLVASGAEVIALACAEFGMVVPAEESPVPVIDTNIAHAQAADGPLQPGI